MFNTIALSSGETDVLLSRLGLSRKQYYSRMFDLVKAGLIMRKNGRNYFLTSFDKVVY
jgi:predicted transcriptional regulator